MNMRDRPLNPVQPPGKTGETLSSPAVICKTDALLDHLRPRHAVMGLDHGESRIGIAICDGQRRLALPLDVVNRKPLHQAFDTIIGHITEYRIGALIIGLAWHKDGRQSPSGRAAIDFAHRLSAASGLPAALVDERFSTRAANTMLRELPLNRRKKALLEDKIAAAWILQTVLDQWQNMPS